MDVEALSRSAAGIASLREQGRALAQTEVPRIFGRPAAIERAEGQLEVARQTLDELQYRLDELGYGPAADALAGARNALEAPEMDRYGLMAVGNGLTSAADAARSRIDVELAAAARSVLRMPADRVGQRELLQLARIVAGDEHGTVMHATGPVADPRRLAGLVSGVDDVAGARDLHASWNAAAHDGERLRADVHELVSRDPADFTQADRDRVSELMSGDPAGLVLTGPRDLRYAPPSFYGVHLPAWDVATMPADAQEQVAREILATPTTDVTETQWRQLQQLLDDRTARIPMHAALEGRDPRELIAAAGGGLGESVARRLHADWTVGQLDDGGHIELARELVRRAPERLSEAEWALLGALTRTQVLGPRKLPGVNEFAEIARANTHQILKRPSQPWDASRYFSAWNEALDPRYLDRVAHAAREVAAGRTTPELVDLLLIERGRIGELLGAGSVEAQRNVVAALLSDGRLSSTRDSREVLELARVALADATGVHEALEPLRQQTLELIDLNLRRLAGDQPEGAVRGYWKHPDYAEVGRIRANMDLIVNASRSRSETRTGPELLTW